MNSQMIRIALLFYCLSGIEAWGSSSGCDLPCRNKGVCKISRQRDLQGDTEFTDAVTNNNVHRSLQQRPHCMCPAGFTGILCEIEYVRCKSAQDSCFNGEPCQRAVDDFGTEFYHCECDGVKSDLSLPSGQKFCEHVSTTFCNNPVGDKNADPKQSRSSSYCNNGGRCKKDTGEERGSHHVGCDCPKGYSGAHCEISDHPQPSNKGSAYDELRAAASTDNPKRRTLLGLLVFFLLMTMFVTAGYTFAVYYGQQQQKKNWKKRGGRSAKDRARIPKTSYRGTSEPVIQPKQKYEHVHEIEMT